MKRALAIDGVLTPDEPPRAPKPRRRPPPARPIHRPTTLPTSSVSGTTSGFWSDGPSQLADPPTSASQPASARAQALLPLCRPAGPGEGSGMFPLLGILPHGKPLFLDGSTTCAGCNRVMFYEHLTDGKCLPCAACRTYALDSRPGAVTRCLNCNIDLEHHADPTAAYQKELIRRAQQEAARKARAAEEKRRAAEEKRARDRKGTWRYPW